MDTYQKYLNLSLKNHPLHPHQVRWIFLRALEDYFAEKIEAGEVASVAVNLHWNAGGESQLAVMRYDRDLDSMLDIAVELDCDGGQEGGVQELKNYLEKHKAMLETLPETCCIAPQIPLAVKKV